MSFQGDVRGIGLAELLQGLARGRKEGVLTLTSRGGFRSVLGMEEGKAWLLPDPEEDQEIWRMRARNAWADDPTFTVNAERMQQVVQAGRLETMYALLDGGGVHFRFDPGAIPDRTTRLEEEGHAKTEIHCRPTAVEFLLLEYARIADEMELAGHPKLISSDMVPCIQHTEELSRLPPTLVQEIDGNSAILEISDRLGWPVRQTQLAIMGGIAKGGLRIAHPIEILRLALHELQRKQFARAASRLSLWCRVGPPGPLAQEDGQALANEWLAGRLTSSLRAMPMRDVRCLLRRLDASLNSNSHAVVHWTEANRIKSSDRVVRLRLMAIRLREEGEGCGLDVREVLDLAREFREHGSPVRSGPALAIAAFLQPASVPQRLELGMGLVQAGRTEEAGPWVVSACTDMLAQGHADRILGPLRALIESDPRNREARELLTRAKRHSTRSKKVRRHVFIAGSVAVLMGGGAVVKVKIDEKRGDQLSNIRQMLTQPAVALEQLNMHFSQDTSVDVSDLKRELEERLRSEELAKRGAWLDEYHSAQKEANTGNVLKALEMVRALPTPPRLKLVNPAWPANIDVLMPIPALLRDEILGQGDPTMQSVQSIANEKKTRATAESLLDALSDEELNSSDFKDFRTELTAVSELVLDRERARSQARLKSEDAATLEKNDQSLKLARDASERNEFNRALRHYEDILSNDPTGKMRRVLRKEIAVVSKKRDAVVKARKVASEGKSGGKHTKAFSILSETFDEDETGHIMLPFEVETTPAGVAVTIQTKGNATSIVRETPFTIEGTFSDEWIFTFALEDFDPRSIEVKGPQDINIFLSRTPEIEFQTSGRVDAVPAPLGDGTTGEYIVCDRNGTLTRVAWDGTVRWRQSIKTVSGFARCPVPLPERDGQMLFLTETGSAWLIDPEDGHVEGNWELGEPPIFGPVVVGKEVHAQLRSGSLARWRNSLRPTVDAPGRAAELDSSLLNGFQGLFSLLRPDGTRNQSLRTAAPGGSGWTLKVEDSRYTVFEDGAEDRPYTIVRSGKWRYVGWETPATAGQLPVLWISDESGLRAFLPPGTKREIEELEAANLAGPPSPELPFAPMDTGSRDTGSWTGSAAPETVEEIAGPAPPPLPSVEPVETPPMGPPVGPGEKSPGDS